MSPSPENMATRAAADDATPSDVPADAPQPSGFPYEERVRLREERATAEAAVDATGEHGKDTEKPVSASTTADSSIVEANAAAPGNDCAAKIADAGSAGDKDKTNGIPGASGATGGLGLPPASDETAIHQHQPPPLLPQGPGGYHFGRGPSSSYGPPPPYEYGGRPHYPPPSYNESGGGHYASLNRGAHLPPPTHHNVHQNYQPTGNNHNHHSYHQHQYGRHAPPPYPSSFGVPPHGQQPPSNPAPAPRNQHVGEEYAKRHSPTTRQQQKLEQNEEEEEKKVEMEDHQGPSFKGATAGLGTRPSLGVKTDDEGMNEGKGKDDTEKSGSATSPSGDVGAANVEPANTTTGILRTSRGSIVADLAADDSHPEADDVEPLPPKALFHSSADGRNNKLEKSPSGIIKDSSVVPGSTGPVKRERHVGFEADSKLPASSAASSHPYPHHSYSYYEQFHHYGHGRPGLSLPPPLSSHPPGSYHHHQPPHSYGGRPAGMGHGMGVDLHYPSPPPPVHSPYYAEYRPHTTGEYRPAASLRRADEEKPHGQQVLQDGDGEKEEAPPVDRAKDGNGLTENSGDANETPTQQYQQLPRSNLNGHGASPYAAYDAYAPYGRYQPPPSGMRIGGGPGNRHYDHSPLDANPDRQKPRAESYEIDPRDPRAGAGNAPSLHSSLDSTYGHSHNASVPPHGYFSHHQEGPFDVRGGMDRLVATPASRSFAPSIRGRQYDSFVEPAGEDPYRHPLGRYATPGGHGLTEYPPLSEIKPDCPHPSPMALDKDNFFRASPQQPGRPSASPISRSDLSGRLSYPPTTPHFDARYQEENFTPLRYDRAHPLPSASKGAESLFPSPAQRSTFSGGITYATPLVRRKGGEDGDKEGNRLDSPSLVAADAAAAAAAHQHFYHQYDGPPSPAANFFPPHPVHGYTPNFGPLPTNTGGNPVQLSAVTTSAKSTTTKKRKKAADGTKKANKSKDDRRQKMYSNYTGVTYNKTHAKYQACITHYRKQHYLGRYKLAVDAARAYDESAKLLKGSGWKINFGAIEEYELAKKQELEHLTSKERAEEEAAADGASGSRKKKKKVTARDLAHIAVKIQVPSSVFKVVSEANGQAAARQAQKIIAEVNQATIERVKMQKENSDSPATSLPPRRNNLPSKTPSNTAGRASMEVTPSPFALGANGHADSSVPVAFTPSNNKTSKGQGGADIAATGIDYTPNSELRPKKIVKEAGAMPTAAHEPKAGRRIITPQQKPGEDEATKALLTLSAMKR